MTELYVIRDRIKVFYAKNARFINPALKFVLAMLVYTIIKNTIGYDERLNGWPVLAGLSVISAFLPTSFIVFAAFVMSVMHIFAASNILCLIYVLILAVLYFFLIRFAPGYGICVLMTPILMYLHLDALMPLVIGLIGTPIAGFAIVPGIIIYYLFDVTKSAISMSSGSMKLEDNLQSYVYVIKTISGNKLMILAIIVSICVLLVTYFVRKLVIAHSNELALAAGATAEIIITLVGFLAFNVKGNILWLLLGTVISVVIAMAIQFMRYVLDYNAVEHLQFDDDDYYYYVTAVPKLTVTKPEKNVVKISDSDDKENEPYRD